ncbi:glutathione S-transferase family protein [Pseudemcibacter aquimaris]|uniref:glutathione S-transferase family protein n=1 Tax=Pseudemcibacter aquimaris TaxID=2857064 RepID=UPI00201362FF|nr:glutathione S-transferase family protein [Pseudemcibacter aquimaris]MCC3862069.1 glutathione S-transferase family protein [Pseudemcibacter aquimaris]WDU58821.1 glutathione S-transferase family protein [Pseudemcibacter aquimaris]
MSDFTLIIGNKNVSSWSLRGWLAVKHSGVDFEEILIRLRPTWNQEELDALTPASKVPALKRGDMYIWDSLAIAEYMADLYPEKKYWPADVNVRGHARSVSAEMHSGFVPLRSIMPMDCLNSYDTPEMTPELEKDINRVMDIWTECREKYGDQGPYLFGEYSIADMMYAPVVFRFKAYGIELPEIIQDYCNSMLSHDDIKAWLDDCDAGDIA